MVVLIVSKIFSIVFTKLVQICIKIKNIKLHDDWLSLTCSPKRSKFKITFFFKISCLLVFIVNIITMIVGCVSKYITYVSG